MFLPGTYGIALIMMLAGMFFWGSWPNTFKLTRDWRIELFYWDYAIGIFLTSIIVGLTLGTFFGPATFWSNLQNADRSALLYAAAAGALWNCGNVLLMFGVSMVGLAVAFPLSIGFALVVGVVGSYMVMPRGNVSLLVAGVAMVFLAVILNSMAYGAVAKSKQKAPKSGLIVCFVAGVLFSGFGPLVGKALSAANPVGPYGVTFLFTGGALLSTVPIMMYFMRRPLAGTALTWLDYKAGTPRAHAAGLLGGFFWGLGTTFTFVPASLVGIALAYAIGQANPLIAALWGVFVWREFRGAPRRAHVLLIFMFLFYLGGLYFLASSFNSK